MNMLSCFTVSIVHDKMFVISCYPLHFLLFYSSYLLSFFGLEVVVVCVWCEGGGGYVNGHKPLCALDV